MNEKVTELANTVVNAIVDHLGTITREQIVEAFELAYLWGQNDVIVAMKAMKGLNNDRQ